MKRVPERIFVARVPGRRVIDPRTGHDLPDGPVSVPMMQFWFRRLADGDVVEVAAPGAPASATVEFTRGGAAAKPGRKPGGTEA